MRYAHLVLLADRLARECSELYASGKLADAIAKEAERIGILTALSHLAGSGNDA